MIKFLIKKFLFPIFAALIVFILMSHNAFLYHEPVGQIVEAKTIAVSPVTDNFANRDVQITQILKIKMLNSSKKNQLLTLTNEADQSQVTGQIYRVGQQVLLRGTGNQSQIVGQKRDALMAALLTLFIGLLIGFIRWRASLFLLLSLALNLLYFIGALIFDVNFAALNVILIFGGLAVVFAASSLLFVLGATRQMLYTLLTTILTTLITFSLALVVISLTGANGIHFEYLNYVTQNPTQFFFVGAIISVLGAIMDGTGDIVAGLFGLFRQNNLNDIRLKQGNYFKSGMAIGQEIIGTLTNVLFMIFMAETFPMTLLLLRNGNSWSYIATIGLNLGLLQTIISAIGIVLAVPITAFVTSFGLTHAESKRGVVK